MVVCVGMRNDSFLPPYFHFYKNVGEIEAEITVCCLDFPALEISPNPFGSLPMKPINWMSQWF